MSHNRLNKQQQTTVIVAGIIIVLVCGCGIILLLAGSNWWRSVQPDEPQSGDSSTAELTVAVSPGMASTFNALVELFNAQTNTTPDGTPMMIRTLTIVPEKMVELSLDQPGFQAVAPDSSIWLNQIDRQAIDQSQENESLIPIGSRRVGEPVRYATSPIVLAAWENVAYDLGWREQHISWQDIQRKATEDPDFKWNHPSTGHASGLLATLAEFYAGAGLTRGLTVEAATSQSTLEYVRAVEATVRFYGEGEDVIIERLSEEGRGFLDAFVTQEQTVIAWNKTAPEDTLVAIYPAEGSLWADHPMALLELNRPGEHPVTDNQRQTYQAFAEFLTGPTAQQLLLEAGYRPADLDIKLDTPGSPFADTNNVDWRQPQTTLQIPAESVVEVVQNVWWYTKRPTNVYLVVDTSGSMEDDNKIGLTRAALQSFVEQIRGDRDQVGLIAFDNEADVLLTLQTLDDTGRQNLQTTIQQLFAAGNTALLDGVWEAYTELSLYGDPEAINAIVVMTDGHENNSRITFATLRDRLDQEQDLQVVIFTIAFGSDADEELMIELAEMGDGQFRRANDTDIEDLYKIISTYF
ncbi:MAG: substrate-binding domain-containing protein [Anaerolineae bacterium]|nr:substrate-binding domain-containing protein [Anaerolineae bacterium]